MEFQYIAIYNWIKIVLLFYCLLNLSPSIKCKSQNISRKEYFFLVSSRCARRAAGIRSGLRLLSFRFEGISMDLARVEYMVDRLCHYLATSRTATSLKKRRSNRLVSPITRRNVSNHKNGVSNREKKSLFYRFGSLTFVEEKVLS